MDRYIGKKIEGRYEVQELIGVGGMSHVFKGYDVLENRTVAIKILKDEFAQDEEFQRRFKNESKAIAVLDHPNIVKIFDVCYGSRGQSIIMEYIEGITLKEYLSRQEKISWKESLHFTTQILDAMDHAHSKGIVHRDLKPQNIMLMSDGSIRIMDFGIARFSRNEQRTVTDKAIGSVHYISPEQAQGESSDQKSDIYSVGVMMYEMLTGSLPFDADSAVSIAIKQISSKPKNPSELNPDIPEGLEEIVLKAMQKTPDDRYESSKAMLADIEEFKKNPSIQFEYKYYSDDSATKYFDAVNDGKTKVMDSIEKTEPEDVKVKKQGKTVLILSAVALAFITITGIFFAWMFLFGGFSDSENIILDDLSGMTIEEIQELDKYSNITFEIIAQEYSDEFEIDTVIRQNPGADTEVKDNTTIQLTMSAGSRELTVPNISEMELSAAETMLTTRNITYTVVEINDDYVKSGYVIETSPSIGSSITTSDTVTVYVSKGTSSTTAAIPDVTGLDQTIAQRLIEQEGFKIDTIETIDSDLPSGTVVSQTPTAGTTADSGTSVTLYISSGNYDKEVSVSVSLPTAVTDVVSLSYEFTSGASGNESLQPSVAKSITISNSGQGTDVLKIYIDGELFKQYSINYTSETAQLVIDNSSKFTNSSEDE